ncbi:MAG: hypothetical protein CMN10_16120 [Roseobacter sp.]|nr:hypothetical protein [Roseobacter sp.]
MATIIFLLDLSIIVTAFLSGIFWWRASRGRMRRICRDEVLDAADLNRMVVAYNRTQILNARAALATAVAGILAGLRLSANYLIQFVP